MQGIYINLICASSNGLGGWESLWEGCEQLYNTKNNINDKSLGISSHSVSVCMFHG